MKQTHLFWLLLIIQLPLCLHAKPPSESGADRKGQIVAIDTTKLHQTYLDGDFDILIVSAEKALKSAACATASESLFVHKHLAVVYAKYPEKSEVAKYHMVRMLNIDLNATLYDMDASDVVYTLFDRVKAENDVRVKRRTATNPKPYAATGGIQSKNSDPGSSDPQRVWRVEPNARPKANREGNSKKWLYWVGGISAVGLGVGVTAYLWPDPKPTIEVNPVDNRTEAKP